MPLHLDIVTPEKKVFSDAVDNVYLPGADGEIGVLPMHAGLVTALKPGELRYLHNGQVVTLAIGSGFAEITQTKVVVLTDMALGEAEIDEQSAEEAIKRAQEKLARRRAQHGRRGSRLSARRHLQVHRRHPLQAQVPQLIVSTVPIRNPDGTRKRETHKPTTQGSLRWKSYLAK